MGKCCVIFELANSVNSSSAIETGRLIAGKLSIMPPELPKVRSSIAEFSIPVAELRNSMVCSLDSAVTEKMY